MAGIVTRGFFRKQKWEGLIQQHQITNYTKILTNSIHFEWEDFEFSVLQLDDLKSIKFLVGSMI
jgi:hypothetical protein